VGSNQGSRKLTYLLVFLAFIVVAAFTLRRVAGPQLRAMSMLLLFTNQNSHGLGTQFARHPCTIEDGSALTADGTLRYRLYIPKDVRDPGGVVLVPGVHHLGIEDPRLQNLARALAGTGILVMTPELQDLADYRISPRSIHEIGIFAVILSTRMKRTVGIMGLSFSGGLALLAARQEDVAKHIGYILAIGAHDDMSRVARFFATDMTTLPDGTEIHLKAHEYGALILVYSHLEDFFSSADVPVARQALREWLWEQPDAMKIAAKMSPAGQEKFNNLLHHRDLLRPALLQEINRRQEEMDAVSPHGQLSELRTPVYLLHGAGDTVIPASETVWLAHEVPATELRAMLISPALVHVDMDHEVTLQQRWALVEFLGKVIRQTDNLPKEIVNLHTNALAVSH